ncbi:ATPase WRNIP1 C26H5.02c like protein [Verticillium longisporum]|uniref:ATPase WRNIP1 C26H5.02c like protein n=1 Tax=Verticillium longisporum TaxID=100787 RepID=A0A8I2Z4X1_VERLO|nr:ATPase WRNIP1 C26H5.02c like protein [Verticillium longisporum]
MAVDCPICNKPVKPNLINNHIDSGCESFVLDPSSSANTTSSPPPSTPSHTNGAGNMLTQPKRSAASTFFQTPASKRQATTNRVLTPNANGKAADTCATTPSGEQPQHPPATQGVLDAPAPKRTKTARSAPLAERMRPQALDDVFGQDLVGSHGVLRSLIETDRVPSMILWGGSGTGKTTIARCIAHRAGSRFIELNATSTGVAEVKKMFLEAANDLALTGRKTIIFCDEIHRFTKAQQDVFLKPVEAGTITLVGATTENPSFRVGAALLSRCRTFTLQKLSVENIAAILRRAVAAECPGGPPPLLSDGANADHLLTLAPKSTRAYRALNNAYSALREPGVAALPVPVHLRNAPTRLMREMGFGAEYKYPPNYRDGKVRQDYLPEGMQGRRFLEDRHLGTEVDPDLEMGDS